MTINTENDKAVVYKSAENGNWYWKRIDTSNGKELSRASEPDGYENFSYAADAAAAYNVGCPVEILDD